MTHCDICVAFGYLSVLPNCLTKRRKQSHTVMHSPKGMVTQYTVLQRGLCELVNVDESSLNPPPCWNVVCSSHWANSNVNRCNHITQAWLCYTRCTVQNMTLSSLSDWDFLIQIMNILLVLKVLMEKKLIYTHNCFHLLKKKLFKDLWFTVRYFNEPHILHHMLFQILPTSIKIFSPALRDAHVFYVEKVLFLQRGCMEWHVWSVQGSTFIKKHTSV